MKRELSSSILVPVKDLAKSGAFSYGAATASQLENDGLNRSGRTMIKRLDRLVSALDLPFVVPEDARAISHDNGNAFAELHGKGTQFFVMARDPIEGNSIAEIAGSKKADLDIISGICLFGAGSVYAVSQDGTRTSFTSPGVEIDNKIATIEASPQLSIYEAEAIVRLSSFINAIVQNKPETRKVLLNNPKVEYYLYMLDAFSQGLISPDLALDWFDTVDARNQRLFNLVKKRLTKPDIVVPSSPLEPMQVYIKEQIALGDTPSVSDAKTILANASTLWQDLFTMLDPQTWEGLNYLSYAYAYLEAGEIVDPNNPHVLLAVENPTESKIFAFAKSIVSKIREVADRRYNIIALYPHEKTLPIGESAKRIMYNIDPPNGNAMKTTRVIFETYKKGDNQ